jgi:Tol biopolymer transport system component
VFLWTGWADSGDLLFSSPHIEMPIPENAGPKDFSVNIYRYSTTGKPKAMWPLIPGGLGGGEGPGGLFDVSPDGKRIAYVVWAAKNENSANEDRNYGWDENWNLGSIYISNSDGSNEQKLAEHVWIATLPRWLSNDRVGCVVGTKKDPSDKGEVCVYLFDIGGKTTDLMPLIQPLLEKEVAREDAEGAKKQAEAAKNAPMPAASTESTTSGLFQ